MPEMAVEAYLIKLGAALYCHTGKKHSGHGILNEKSIISVHVCDIHVLS